MLLVHPDFVFGLIDDAKFSKYEMDREKREKKAFHYMQKVITSKAPLVQVGAIFCFTV